MINHYPFHGTSTTFTESKKFSNGLPMIEYTPEKQANSATVKLRELTDAEVLDICVKLAKPLNLTVEKKYNHYLLWDKRAVTLPKFFPLVRHLTTHLIKITKKKDLT